MIIKQYHDVILGNKTQTRRLKDRYQVGRVYSVVPKMYQPAIWWRENADGSSVIAHDAIDYQPTYNPYDGEVSYEHMQRIDNRNHLRILGYRALQIRITGKRTEPLQSITHEDALAEGIEGIQGLGDSFYFSHKLTEQCFMSPVEAYEDLWRKINTKPGTRWEDNPTVTVYCFEVVK